MFPSPWWCSFFQLGLRACLHSKLEGLLSYPWVKTTPSTMANALIWTWNSLVQSRGISIGPLMNVAWNSHWKVDSHFVVQWKQPILFSKCLSGSILITKSLMYCWQKKFMPKKDKSSLVFWGWFACWIASIFCGFINNPSLYIIWPRRIPD
jgi:hypothetical protein